MILGLLRTRLQGTRRIPLSIGKFLVGFEPLRQILGAAWIPFGWTIGWKWNWRGKDRVDRADQNRGGDISPAGPICNR